MRQSVQRNWSRCPNARQSRMRGRTRLGARG
jgi:hypothetical protein